VQEAKVRITGKPGARALIDYYEKTPSELSNTQSTTFNLPLRN
jgi:hypothetical protein